MSLSSLPPYIWLAVFLLVIFGSAVYSVWWEMRQRKDHKAKVIGIDRNKLASARLQQLREDELSVPAQARKGFIGGRAPTLVLHRSPDSPATLPTGPDRRSSSSASTSQEAESSHSLIPLALVGMALFSDHQTERSAANDCSPANDSGAGVGDSCPSSE